MFIFPVQLTTSRIGNLTRLIHTLLYVMTIHTYIHTYYTTRRSWKEIRRFWGARGTQLKHSLQKRTSQIYCTKNTFNIAQEVLLVLIVQYATSLVDAGSRQPRRRWWPERWRIIDSLHPKIIISTQQHDHLSVQISMSIKVLFLRRRRHFGQGRGPRSGPISTILKHAATNFPMVILGTINSFVRLLRFFHVGNSPLLSSFGRALFILPPCVPTNKQRPPFTIYRSMSPMSSILMRGGSLAPSDLRSPCDFCHAFYRPLPFSPWSLSYVMLPRALQLSNHLLTDIQPRAHGGLPLFPNTVQGKTLSLSYHDPHHTQGFEDPKQLIEQPY